MNFNGLTPKQAEFVREANSRWNIKSGATRSGKTYLDRLYTIPKNITRTKGLDGLSVIFGVTKATIERNVLQPMRTLYGEGLVGKIRNDNTCRLFGDEVYCLGAEKVSQQTKVRGASFKYVYGDEVAEWSEEVFNLIKSRLDQKYSRFDGTCNPKHPTHWLKKFIDNSDIDVYYQPYTIFDNPTLDPLVVKSLCAEYRGTVDFERYIKGKWVAAIGGCYPTYNASPDKFYIAQSKLPQLNRVTVGVDFGGNQSATTFVSTGFTRGFVYCIPLITRKLTGIITPQRLDDEFVDFIKEVDRRFGGGKTLTVYCDSAEQTLIAGLKQATRKKALPVQIFNAIKSPIVERVRLVNRLIGAERFRVLEGCEHIEDALTGAIWNPKSWEDERLDDGTSDIDTLDAFEYSIEPFGSYLLEARLLEARL